MVLLRSREVGTDVWTMLDQVWWWGLGQEKTREERTGGKVTSKCLELKAGKRIHSGDNEAEYLKISGIAEMRCI